MNAPVGEPAPPTMQPHSSDVHITVAPTKENRVIPPTNPPVEVYFELISLTLTFQCDYSYYFDTKL